jgi:glycosyltransferase involved in cell wall biosynthesis
MKLLYVADGRSPIAINWIEYFIDQGHEVHLVSTFDVIPDLNLKSFEFVPVAFSQMKGKTNRVDSADLPGGIFWGSSMVNLRTSMRRIIAPLTVSAASKRLKDIIDRVNPDLIHAMRIPFEGMLASRALQDKQAPPLVISVWGNDFTLHAAATPWMAKYTRSTLVRVNGLHTDCQRDLILAHQWGFADLKPSIVVPGNGGVQTDLFYPPKNESRTRADIVINPRGFRSYIRNDSFFKAIPEVLKQRPHTRFVCPDMAGVDQALRWIDDLGIEHAVELLPKVSREEMAGLFRKAAVAVSPSSHDGTPNTLLEAMACGCFPVAGDLESLREWIDPGINGFLVDPADPSDIAAAIVEALERTESREQALIHNQKLIKTRAEYNSSMASALNFYQTLIKN